MTDPDDSEPLQSRPMWGVYNSGGYVCRMSDDRQELMRWAAEFWGKPWRTLQRRGTMSLHRVWVSPFLEVAP